MKRWHVAFIATCTVVFAASIWFVPPSYRGLIGLLLVTGGAVSGGMAGGIVCAGLAVAFVVVEQVFSPKVPWPSVSGDALAFLIAALAVGRALDLGRRQRASLRRALASLEVSHAEQGASERRFRALFEASNDAIYLHEINEDGSPGTYVEVNEAACMSLGYSRDELLAMSPAVVSAPETASRVCERGLLLLSAGNALFETVHMTRDGHRIPVEVSARMIDVGGHRLCLSVARDIAARKELEGLLRNMSHQDELTGLLNRRGFFTMIDHECRRARRLGAKAVLLYADLDGLKVANDALGHAAGDALLLAAGEALRSTFRDSDVVARIGGDEFVALAVLGRDDDDRLDEATIGRRLEEALETKRAELGAGYDLEVSYGMMLADWTELGEIDVLLARADGLMYRQKRARAARRRQSKLITR
jgi:diguanylate cyclase (GGDEF)-like protein/PAS domain S-box-containing protein